MKGREHIRNAIIEARGADHPEMSQSDYIQFVLSNITRSTEQHIEHGFVTDSGDVIGYTQQHEGNIHYVLAVYYTVMLGCYNQDLNVLFFMDNELNAIKIKNNQIFAYNDFIEEIQVSHLINTLEHSSYKMFVLGWDPEFEQLYSASQIKQMDLIMLKKHLTK